MSSVDIFGRAIKSRGTIGPPGPPGPEGARGPAGLGGIESIVRWLPETALEQFRKIESSCLLLTDPSRDVSVDDPKSGRYVKWNSRSNSKFDAMAIYPSIKIVDVSKTQHALLFRNNLYKITGPILSPTDEHSYTCICITFRLEMNIDDINNGESEKDQFLISDYGPDIDDPNNFRGISVTSKNVKIWGASNHKFSYITIPYHVEDFSWTTIFVQWSNINHDCGTYVINDPRTMQGLFCANTPSLFEQTEIFIGGQLVHGGAKNSFRGCISAVEVYCIPQAKEDGLPVVLRDLIMKNQRIENNEK